MKSPVKYIALVLFSLAAFAGFAQNQPGNALASDNLLQSELDKAIDKSVQAYFKDAKAVGLSIGITISGKDYFYNYGQLESDRPVLPNSRTIYELGSITKTFTGILLGQAVQEKKLSLDDDIRKYLDGNYPNLEYNSRPVRVVNLSNHTSRVTRIFPNNWERKDYIEDNPFANYTREMFFEGLHNMKMDMPAGIKYSYSNMGAALLGIILERVYGDSYFALVNDHILKPLKMESTTIDLSKADKNNIARSHSAERKVVPFWDAPAIPAMGALRSNTTDMVRYIRANNEEKLPGIALAHQFTFEGEEGSLGLNWFFHTTKDGIKILEHTGGTGGARCSLQCFPQLRSGFVILTNSLANRNTLEKELSDLVLKLSKSSN